MPMGRSFHDWFLVPVCIFAVGVLTLLATPLKTLAATGDTDTVSGSAWTNGSITQPFTGTETDIAIGGNDGIPQVSAIEIANRQAMNGYGPGDYIFTTSQFIEGNGVNSDYARRILGEYRFTILNQTTGQSSYGYYAGSDVYVLLRLLQRTQPVQQSLLLRPRTVYPPDPHSATVRADLRRIGSDIG